MSTSSREPTADLRSEMYEARYAEIRENSTIVANLFTVTITAAATIVSFGVELQQPGLFLATFILLIPSLSVITSQLASTARIGAYIAARMEDDESGVHWETDVLEFRKRGSERYGVSIASLYGIIGATCVTLSFYYVDYDDHAAVAVVAGFSVLAVALLVALLKQAVQALSTENMSRMRATWQEIIDSSHDR